MTTLAELLALDQSLRDDLDRYHQAGNIGPDAQQAFRARLAIGRDIAALKIRETRATASQSHIGSDPSHGMGHA